VTTFASGVKMSAAPVIADRAYRPLGTYRFMLAALVLLSHCTVFIPGPLVSLSLGNVGVFLFFVVSGFVISEALDLFYSRSVGRFLANRALKIFPSYWVAAILGYVVLSLEDLTSPLFEPWPLLVNATLLLGYLPGSGTHLILPITWAVIVECQFYLVAATIGALAMWLDRARVVAAAVTLAIAGYAFVWLTGSQARFFGVLQHGPFFVFGGLLYVAVSRGALRYTVAAAGAGVLSFHAYWIYISRLGSAADPPLSIAIFAALLAGLVYLCRARTSSVLIQADRRLGDLTYAIYLLHTPMIAVALLLNLANGPAVLFVVIATSVAAVLTHFLVEQPIAGLRDRFRGLKLYG
jgi:peptidoglycan/LPS O-acetylase OafA/YrhL